MGDEDGIGMGRELDFRDDLDVVPAGVLKDGTDVVLGVVTAVCPRGAFVKIALVLLVPPFYPVLLRAVGALGGEFRVAVELDAPSAVVGQVDNRPSHPAAS